ncbi:protein of unknown function DUF306 Meta and HslJ [Beutenbergia cavernae DSM 12333]|uniref:DUF306 domain-containing protein n=1 Tax=Beutenbergia cavernae (strain ATCC BAA-8 / DSM 12333 / CCUG 43141 / JCM 11478 / NBRC 16432 / NCIMB 13614 / HKI 0122) TaxID=471853 RepID=C5C2Y7_BEUC1|nr:META domain-containing protein [Beutenbergia cavernae]ACQ81831.1 protein of unknown function DUF306 Meta and HslJ [Beutenbergia cavernae DSM 12333]
MHTSSAGRRRPAVAPLLLAAGLAVATLAACGDGTPGGPVDLDGDWRLVSATIDEAALVLRDDYPVTLQVEGTEASGTSACNGYFATVEPTSDSVRFTGIGGTEMACEDDVMSLEATYLEALGRVTEATRDGGLTLEGDGVTLAFEAVPPLDATPFVGPEWLLLTLVEGETASSPLAGAQPATLRLADDGSLAATTGCRSMTGTWEERAGEIVLTDAALDGDCPTALARQDALVVAVLGDGFTAEVDDLGELHLRSSGGFGLDYTTAVRLPTTPPDDEISTPSPAPTS